MGGTATSGKAGKRRPLFSPLFLHSAFSISGHARFCGRLRP